MFVARALSVVIDIIRGQEYYKKYKKLYSKNLRKIPSFQLISKLAKGQVLDVGCGLGYLSKLFSDYVGVDINKEAINLAKKNTRRVYIIGSAYHLPFRAKIFDTCILYDLIEHLQDVEKALSEVKRISRLNVIISCVNFRSYYKWFTYDKTHVNCFTSDELLTLLKKYFRVIRMFKTSGIFSVPGSVNTVLSKFFPNQIILEVSK